ncbi:MAG: protein-L-isoaspartate(D-aspartate) O-methyltransferase [Firmicutes bacterium]|nr:protein-L-isoaspartate(D-aspartate) O-methyltransferase [Bacillota bacterium]
MDDSKFTLLRRQMIRDQLEPRGINDPAVLEAFSKVPRHLFVAEENRHLAYRDHPLPIGEEQTISQPYIVALMTQSLELQGHEKVLEIGTGSGYQSAILAELTEHVYTVERIEKLSLQAREVHSLLGYKNISYKIGDGAAGWPEESPFDGILVTAAAAEVPPLLLEQLRPGGRMVIPVGDRLLQDLLLITKEETGINVHKLCGCRFVPLIT